MKKIWGMYLGFCWGVIIYALISLVGVEKTQSTKTVIEVSDILNIIFNMVGFSILVLLTYNHIISND